MSSSNIDYGKIIKRSIEIVKKHKWLWVYGLILTFFSGGNYNFGSNSSSLFSEIQENFKPEKRQQTMQVLGETTTLLKQWVTDIPASSIVLIVLALFSLLIFAITISLIIRNWAKGSLIAGMEKAHNNEEVTISNSSPTGRKKIKPLFLSGLITALITITVFATLAFLWAFPLLILKESVLKTLIIVLFIMASILIVIFTMILFSLLNLYADRLIVLQNYSVWEAWKKGLKLTWKHFLPTILMRLINASIGCTVSCLTSIILLLFSGGSIIAVLYPIIKGKKRFGFSALVVILFSIVLFFVLSLLVRTLLVVFNYSNWHIMFKKILAREEE
jgi:hypothetical protein